MSVFEYYLTDYLAEHAKIAQTNAQSILVIANRIITKMSHFKIYSSITLIFRKQASLNVDNSHISLYVGFFEINTNE